MKLGIYGTGGVGLEVYQLAVNVLIGVDWHEVIYIDDTKAPGRFKDCEMLPFTLFYEKYRPEDTKILIAQGEPKYRKLLGEKVKEHGYRLQSIISPEARIDPDARIGEGALIHAGTSISAEVIVGENVMFNGVCTVGHHVQIGDNSIIGSFAFIGGHTKIGDSSYIGPASSVRDRLEIGERSVISMGAVVVRNVRPCGIVMGNPAREIGLNEGQNIFK